MTQSILLIISFIVGAAVASAIFAFAGAGRRKKLEAEAEERAQAQDTISALLADADAVEAGYRAGTLAPENFRRSLGEKVNAATRELRTRMHGLDVFFVKYAEMQVEEYMRVLENPERRKDGLTVPAAFARAAVEPAAAVQPPPPPKIEPPEAEAPEAGFEPPTEAPAPIFVPEPIAPPAPEPIVESAFEPVLGDIVEEAETFAPPPPPETPTPEPIQVQEKPIAEEPAPIPEPIQIPEPEPILGGPVLGEPILGEPEFDFPIPAPAPLPPPPVPAPAAVPAVEPAPAADAWSDESIEEFEAAFTQFEEEPATQEASAETGSFPVVEDAPPPEPAPAPTPVAPPQYTEEDHMMTETSSIDKAAIMSALTAAQQVQTPQQPQSVHRQASVQPIPSAQQQAHINEQQPEQQQQQQQGITGDDVVDVIDSFFNLK